MTQIRNKTYTLKHQTQNFQRISFCHIPPVKKQQQQQQQTTDKARTRWYRAGEEVSGCSNIYTRLLVI